MRKHLNREKVNFMINKELLMQFRQLIPSGERSNFANEALEKAIIRYGREKAFEAFDRMAEENAFPNISTKEFLKIRHEGLL